MKEKVVIVEAVVVLALVLVMKVMVAEKPIKLVSLFEWLKYYIRNCTEIYLMLVLQLFAIKSVPNLPLLVWHISPFLVGL